jgi:hypothetical protein
VKMGGGRLNAIPVNLLGIWTNVNETGLISIGNALLCTVSSPKSKKVTLDFQYVRYYIDNPSPDNWCVLRLLEDGRKRKTLTPSDKITVADLLRILVSSVFSRLSDQFIFTFRPRVLNLLTLQCSC